MQLEEFVEVGLSWIELRALFKHVFGYTSRIELADDVDEGVTAILWVAVLLKRVRPALTESQQFLVLEKLYVQTDQLIADGDTDTLLIFLDGKHVVWSGLSGFLDLATGDIHNETPVAPLMSVCYNLSEFIRRQTAGTTHAASTPDS